ncbi:hypothetical protein U1Q18_015671 [Sarracenia purpurea var. burkii]
MVLIFNLCPGVDALLAILPLLGLAGFTFAQLESTLVCCQALPSLVCLLVGFCSAGVNAVVLLLFAWRVVWLVFAFVMMVCCAALAGFVLILAGCWMVLCWLAAVLLGGLAVIVPLMLPLFGAVFRPSFAAISLSLVVFSEASIGAAALGLFPGKALLIKALPCDLLSF